MISPTKLATPSRRRNPDRSVEAGSTPCDWASFVTRSLIIEPVRPTVPMPGVAWERWAGRGDHQSRSEPVLAVTL